MHDIADYLSRLAPFSGLEPTAIAQIADQVEIEFFAAGETIFEQGQTPAERVRIVVSGAVELRDQGRTLDVLGPGEMFGHPSMLAGLPTGLAVHAYEDSICYRLPTDLLVPLLTRPEGLQYIARSLLERQWRPPAPNNGPGDPTLRPVGAFIRESVVICEPTTSVRNVAREMVAAGASSALVRLGGDTVGVFTDHDLRTRVVAGDVPLDAPVEQAMTAPAYTVRSSRLGSEVLVEMINRGIRHVPVTSARGELVGVVTDVDLLASETRTPFMVRRAIARADTIDRLIEVAADLRPTAIALHDSKIASGQLAAIIAAFSDSLTRRAIELLTAEMDDLAPFAWLATGSIGRREAFPSSDIDCAIAWEGSPAYGERFRALAEQVLDVLARCRFASDSHSASAAHPLFARSTGGWRASISRWLDRADDPRLLIVISLLADRHTVHRTSAVDEPFEALSDAHRHPELIRELRRLALAHRPPTGFLRNMVLEHSGEHRGRLDIKQAGFLPIVDLARYLAFANAITATGTVERLNAASEAGAIGAEDALALIEAFDLFVGLRMGHQIEQLRRDQPISDFIDPAELNPLTRRYLREAFRAIARSQRKLPQFHER